MSRSSAETITRIEIKRAASIGKGVLGSQNAAMKGPALKTQKGVGGRWAGTERKRE